MQQYTVQGALSNYQAASAQMAVEGASPHRLIEMLLERALSRIAIAKGHMNRGNVAEKGEHVSGAMAIVDGLRTFLDFNAGGDLAANLDSLYEYMSRRLLEANLRNDSGILDEVSSLLKEIRSAWVDIGDSVDSQRSTVASA